MVLFHSKLLAYQRVNLFKPLDLPLIFARFTHFGANPPTTAQLRMRWQARSPSASAAVPASGAGGAISARGSPAPGRSKLGANSSSKSY